MRKIVLDYLCKMEGWLTACKSLHWNAKNLSQHKLCDDISDRIKEFQDQVAEVEQSINGKLPFNKLHGTNYQIKDIKKFVEDVINDSSVVYKKLESLGETYAGMRSDFESFMSDMQRNLYLVDFTIKEDLGRRLKTQINEVEGMTLEGKRFKSIKVNLKGGGYAKLNAEVDFDECRASWMLEGDEGDPLSDGTMEIETYMDGSWAPYEETMRPQRIPPTLKNALYKLYSNMGMSDEATIFESKEQAKTEDIYEVTINGKISVMSESKFRAMINQAVRNVIEA